MIKSTTVLFWAVWLEISADPIHQDLSLCNETILRRIRSLQPTLNVTRKVINRALQSVADSYHQLNILGLIHVNFRDI